MARYTKMSGGGIIAMITLVLKVIAKKDAHSRARGEFDALSGRKKHKASIVKTLK